MARVWKFPDWTLDNFPKPYVEIEITKKVSLPPNKDFGFDEQEVKRIEEISKATIIKSFLEKLQNKDAFLVHGWPDDVAKAVELIRGHVAVKVGNESSQVDVEDYDDDCGGWHTETSRYIAGSDDDSEYGYDDDDDSCSGVVQRVRVPRSEHIARIIGTKGTTLRQIERNTGAVSFSETPDHGEKPVITLQGRDQDEIKAAVNIMQKLVNQVNHQKFSKTVSKTLRMTFGTASGCDLPRASKERRTKISAYLKLDDAGINQTVELTVYGCIVDVDGFIKDIRQRDLERGMESSLMAKRTETISFTDLSDLVRLNETGFFLRKIEMQTGTSIIIPDSTKPDLIIEGSSIMVDKPLQEISLRVHLMTSGRSGVFSDSSKLPKVSTESVVSAAFASHPTVNEIVPIVIGVLD